MSSNKTLIGLLAWLTLSITAGCLPSTRIVKNPGDRDRGVRYYRPKPYLMVKPLINKLGEPVAGFVSLEQVVLPDFSEEYSIHVRTGLGTNDTQIKLTDGWRLDSLNVDLDSNFDDNLSAIADIARAVPGLTAGNDDDKSNMPVPASNVPIGYYESVISKGCDGKKRLYGFRYVGFMPYSACPLESCGSERTSCYDGQVYGLVFDGKQMEFQLLHDVATERTIGRIPESEHWTPDQNEPKTLPHEPDDSMLEDEDRGRSVEDHSVSSATS
jgi:hypothetical protein